MTQSSKLPAHQASLPAPSTRRSMSRRFAWGLLAALVGVLAGVVQGEPGRSVSTARAADLSPWQFGADSLPRHIGVVTLPGIVSLQPISLGELTQSLRGGSTSSGAISAGSWNARDGRAALASHEVFQIRRELPDLWRLRLPSDDGAFQVNYEVIAANGRRGRLSHPRHSDSEIRVVARPLLPRVIDGDGDTTVYEGGVDLRLRLDDALVAGEHSGTVMITLSRL